VAFSLLEAYDELMGEDCCLKWSENSPSSFFKQEVEPTYQQLCEKKEAEREPKFEKSSMNNTIDLSTIPGRQTISSALDRPFFSRNLATVRSRRTRYSDIEPGEIFAHKSTRRFRTPLNSSLGMT
jgi:hypothetical protein